MEQRQGKKTISRGKREEQTNDEEEGPTYKVCIDHKIGPL